GGVRGVRFGGRVGAGSGSAAGVMRGVEADCGLHGTYRDFSDSTCETNHTTLGLDVRDSGQPPWAAFPRSIHVDRSRLRVPWLPKRRETTFIQSLIIARVV